MGKLTIIPGNAQHLGNRAEQQDSFGFSDLQDPELLDRCGALAVVADGMGGHALGREASQIAVQTLLDGYPRKAPDEPILAALQRLAGEANAAVRELAAQEGEIDNAGTTLAAAVIHQQRLYWLSVGDSRIYLYHAGRATLLTTDHIYARYLERRVAAGQLHPDDAAEHPDREALTSYLGIPELAEIECGQYPALLQAGDRVLVCSDGLYRDLSEKEVAAKLAHRDPQAAAEALLSRVLAWQRRYQDNLTAVILAVVRTPAARSDRRRIAVLLGLLLISISLAAGGWLGQWP